MISPSNASVDYGAMLKAPDGYEVDFAIATTYSLDMHALMGAYLSLGLSVDTDSSLAKDSMYLFAALSEMKGKVLVFCEKGRITGRGEYSSLYCQLEGGIVEADLPEVHNDAVNSEFPSFHPKTWVLRFTSASGAGRTLYRVCILSRNLTFDSSWDLAGSFDGHFRDQHKSASEGGYSLAAYLKMLKGLYGSGPFAGKLDQVIGEIPYVTFNCSEKECRLALPFSFSGVPGAKRFDEEFSCALARSTRAMVMTPFLSGASSENDPVARISEHFTGSDERPILVTRRNSIAANEQTVKRFEGFRVFAVRDDLVTAEFERGESEGGGLKEGAAEAGAQMDSRDIHAKAYLFDCADDEDRCELFVGSANASAKGFFANCEAMAHLAVQRGNAYVSILRELGLTDDELEKGSLFGPLDSESMLQLVPPDDAERKRLEIQQGFDHFLRRAVFSMRIKRSEKGGFDVFVGVKGDASKMGHCTVSLATGGVALAMSKQVVFADVALSSLTGLVRVSYDEGDYKAQRLMKCKLLEGASFLEQQRKELFRQVTKNRFSEYLEFRLSGNPEYVASLFGDRAHVGLSQRQTGVSSYSGLYENLLRAYVTKPLQTDALVAECLDLLETDQREEIDNEVKRLAELLKTIREGARYARS